MRLAALLLGAALAGALGYVCVCDSADQPAIRAVRSGRISSA